MPEPTGNAAFDAARAGGIVDTFLSFPDVKEAKAKVYDYIRKIRGGTAKDRAGRPMIVPDAVPFYCYVVCDKTPKLREIAENYQLTEAPDGLGYFGFNSSHRAYVEVMTFNKLVGDAEKRNRILFTKLNLPK